jgi:hypothetical protein
MLHYISSSAPAWARADRTALTALVALGDDTNVLEPMIFHAIAGADGLSGEVFAAVIASGVEIGAWVAPSAPVPVTVTARQIQLALLDLGQLDEVELYIATAPRAEQIEWARASTIHRDHPMWDGIATALGKTSPDIDDLFVLAGGK